MVGMYGGLLKKPIGTKYRIKTFTASGDVDKKFAEWIDEHEDIEILDIKYQAQTEWDSIIVLYAE